MWTESHGHRLRRGVGPFGSEVAVGSPSQDLATLSVQDNTLWISAWCINTDSISISISLFIIRYSFENVMAAHFHAARHGRIK